MNNGSGSPEPDYDISGNITLDTTSVDYNQINSSSVLTDNLAINDEIQLPPKIKSIPGAHQKGKKVFGKRNKRSRVLINNKELQAKKINKPRADYSFIGDNETKMRPVDSIYDQAHMLHVKHDTEQTVAKPGGASMDTTIIMKDTTRRHRYSPRNDAESNNEADCPCSDPLAVVYVLWRCLQRPMQRPMSLGLRLITTFVLMTFTIEVTMFMATTGYHLYHGKAISYETLSEDFITSATNGTTPLVPMVTSKRSDNPTIEEFFKYLNDFCHRKTVIISNANMSVCPCISPFLQGFSPIQLENVPTFGEMELNLTDLQSGGYFRPRDCIPRHHVTIIVPFRDREEHLRIFLNHMHSFLQRQLIEYRMFVVEEVHHKIFNKAMMMNIGFVESQKMFASDCVIFHDVDMLPEDDRNLYICMEKPRHLGAFCNKWDYKLPYPGLFGGAISLTPAQFRHVNGFSNEYFGWGGEDDDMYQRVVARNYNITRFPQIVSKYTMLKHKRDRWNPFNNKGVKGFRARPKHYQHDGLNTLSYIVKTIEHRPLYTWIQADIEIPGFAKPENPSSGHSLKTKKSSLSCLMTVLYTAVLCVFSLPLCKFRGKS